MVDIVVPGPQGPALNWRGDYDPGAAYVRMDVVKCDTGATYWLTVAGPVTGVYPPANSDQWGIAAEPADVTPALTSLQEQAEASAEAAASAAQTATEQADISVGQAGAAAAARSGSETARDASIAARVASEEARDASQGYRDQAQTYSQTASAQAVLAANSASSAVQAGLSVSAPSWAVLATLTPAQIGQRAQVSTNDSGTHSGRTAASPSADAANVPNSGVYGGYALTVGAWRRDGDISTVGAASSPETITGAVTDKHVTPAGDKAALDARFNNLVVGPAPKETGFILTFTDPETRRCLGGITLAGQWVFYDLVYPAGSVTDAALSTSLQGRVAAAMPPEIGLPLAFTDPVTRRVSAKMDADGTWTFYSINLPAGAVTFNSLDASLKNAMPSSSTPESGVLWCLSDPVTRRMAISVGYDGKTYVYSPVFGADAVSVSALQQEVRRQALPQRGDVIPVRPDIWRQRSGEVSVETSLLDGAMYTTFPDRPVRLLRGVNNTGAPISIRKASGLQIIGRQYIGAYDPGAWPSINYRGYLYGASVATPNGTFAAGDYYRFDGSTAGVWNGNTLNNGDCLVYGSDAAWHVQVSPGSGTTRSHKSFWQVSAAGWYDGKPLATNDRIMFVSLETLGGNPFLPARWYRGNTADLDRNDLWWRGEFAPAGGYPASPVHGDIYQANAAGTISGVAYADGDFAIYESGAWARIENAAARTYANGEAVTLPCAALASEWEVRRADKSAGSTRLAVRLTCQLQSVPKRSLDTVLLMSDSMFGNGGVGTQIIAALPGRVGSVRSNGGSTSRQVLGMMEYAAASGDADLAKLIIAWHGQNNQPGTTVTDLNMALIKECSLRMWDFVGARDAKIVFLSILGQRNHSWDGTRIVCSQQENQFTKNGALWMLRQWYDRTFPGQVVHPLDILLAAAGNTLDPTHPVDPSSPGSPLMTEKQVAAKWGIAPWSFFGSSGLTVPVTSLAYKGTWTGAALPTDGPANDYYLRIDGSGSGVGALLVNEAGVWVERQIDITHLGTSGGAAMATGGTGSALGAGYNVIPSHPGVAGFIINSNL